MGRVNKSALVDKAVSAIQRGEFRDYSAAAAHFGCHRTAVSRRIRGLTKTRKDANSFYRQCLTNAQEEVLIGRINYLTERGMPPTSAIVKNLAEEIRGRPVGKNWVGQFIRRHKERLTSLYLRNIDNLRVGAEYAPMFKLFFDLVSNITRCCRALIYGMPANISNAFSWPKKSRNTTLPPITYTISMRKGS
jgi:hypothetical protein